MTFHYSRPIEELIEEASGDATVLADLDVLIVGSGYGGAVAAKQLCGLVDPAAGREVRVMVLERGKEYEVGEFAEGESYLGLLLESMRKAQRGPSHHYVSSAITIPIVARITRTDDLLDVARDAANTVLSSPYIAPIFAQWARAKKALNQANVRSVEWS